MAFSSSSFLNGTSLSPISRALTYTLGTNFQSAQALASQLSSSGSSLSSVVDIASQKLDSIVSGGGSEYFGFAGKAIERILPSDLNIFRSGSSDSDIGSINPESKILNSQGQNGSSSLTYPNDIGDYFVSFNFADYIRPTPTSQSTFQTQMTVNLPVPNNLVEAYKTNYNIVELGVFGMAADAVSESIDYLKGRSSGNQMSVAKGGADILGFGYALADQVLATLPGLGEQAVAAIGQFFGAIPNPHISVAFNGPSLRSHQFKWRFAPETADDSANLKKIIAEIRKRMLPTKSIKNSANILNYPQMVQIQLHPEDNEGDELFKFKKAVVADVHFNYAPLGIPSFFGGTKLPTLIDLQINLLEIEYFLGDDFGRSDAASFDDIGNALEKIPGVKQAADITSGIVSNVKNALSGL